MLRGEAVAAGCVERCVLRVVLGVSAEAQREAAQHNAILLPKNGTEYGINCELQERKDDVDEFWDEASQYYELQVSPETGLDVVIELMYRDDDYRVVNAINATLVDKTQSTPIAGPMAGRLSEVDLAKLSEALAGPSLGVLQKQFGVPDAR